MWCTKITTAALLVALTISTCQIESVKGANILGIFTSHSPSHLIVHMSVAKALAEKGHNVTVVTSLEPKVDHKSIRKIIIPPTPKEEQMMNNLLNEMSSQKNSIFSTIKNILTSMTTILNMQIYNLKDKRFTMLYETPDTKFDVVILGFFMNDFQLGIAAKFKCPVIVNWMGPTNPITDKFIGNPNEVAYVPSPMVATKVGECMSFMQRVKNFIFALVFRFIAFLLSLRMNSCYRQLFPSTNNFPSLSDMHKNISLVFVNNHFTEGPVRPNVPALVEIGGIQVKDKPDPLPEDIAEFLQASKQQGAILFSLGSNLKSSHIKPETTQIIFKTLSSLKQNIIWKWDDLKNTPGTAKNILYKKWLPQDDILAHPNLKLFITHAGKGGVVEAQYHGVPMVALPVFADQNTNAEKLVSLGYGKTLELLSLTETDFKQALLEVLNNPVYAENIKKFSQLYRDRPMTAKQSVVFWTEYVIRHHGAPHMQSPLVHLNTIQSLSLDVIAFICLALYVAWRIIKFVIFFVWRKIFSKDIKYKKVKKH